MRRRPISRSARAWPWPVAWRRDYRPWKEVWICLWNPPRFVLLPSIGEAAVIWHWSPPAALALRWRARRQILKGPRSWRWRPRSRMEPLRLLLPKFEAGAVLPNVRVKYTPDRGAI